MVRASGSEALANVEASDLYTLTKVEASNSDTPTLVRASVSDAPTALIYLKIQVRVNYVHFINYGVVFIRLV